jgi:hypothetical protein
MRYIQIEVGISPDKPHPWWGKLLRKVLPAANPDMEQFYALTRKWWLEIDDVGKPQREIGFDSENTPIVLGPVGNNPGFLIDSSDDWKDSVGDSAEAKNEFENTWQVLWKKFSHLEAEK